MSNRTKSALKKSPKSPRNTQKKRVQIVPEKNIEILFERPFDKVEVPELWTSKNEQHNARLEKQNESIREVGPIRFFQNNSDIRNKINSHRKSTINETNAFFRKRRDLPFMTANLARMKLSRTIKKDVNDDEGSNNRITLKRTKSSRYLGGKSKTKRRYRK